MSLAHYLETRYVAACDLQRSIGRDLEMITMLQEGTRNEYLVRAWMRDYGLFQGIAKLDRRAIARAFLDFASRHHRRADVPGPDDIRRMYDTLFRRLHNAVGRSWMSATSKLLWCLYPESVAIYDSFVHRVLLVLQCVDPDLQGSARLGEAPRFKGAADVPAAVQHYMTYEAAVRRLLEVHATRLAKLRKRHNEQYPYDIRILDKLLWMIGNPRQEWPGQA